MGVEESGQMKRIDRRTFMLVASVGGSGAVLTACGNTESTDANLSPTMIPDVAGAPPTLAPQATPGGGAQEPAAGAPAAEEAPAEGAPAASGGAGEPIPIEAQDPYAWSVNELEAAPGQIIQATNAGFLEHNFAVDEWGIEEDLPPGEPVEITVPEDAEVGAAFVYYCSVPGHREGGMEGTLTIIEAGAPPAAASGGQASPPAAEQAPASPDAAAVPATPDTPVTAPSPATPVAPPAVATPAPGTIALYAEDPSVWNPNALTVSAGDTLSIVNTGVLQHDFTVEEWSISQYLPNGGLVEIQVPTDAQTGQTFAFYCSEHREQGMEGTLTIR